MRLGLALGGAGGLEALLRQAVAADDAGLELVWIDADAGGPPLLTAAAVATHTESVRLVVAVRVGDHPLALAEDAFVLDALSAGRLVLVVEGGAGDEDLLAESADVLLAAASTVPFRHAGPRWTIPAELPENDGAQPRIVVTPAPVNLEMPLWLAGPASPPVARARGLSHVAGADDGAARAAWATTDGALGLQARRLRRPALRDVALAHDGALDAGALVADLLAARDGWGLDVALLRLPAGATVDAREAAALRLATAVRPRVQHPLPEGLEEHWDQRLALELGTDLEPLA
jgi:alkanesulfonate monooxygenase SsuD/methylene tetrahydromethanopterin reductase-like flavin-dependent oxidoreductase (luciferase family)